MPPPYTKPPVEKSDAEWLQDHNYANLEAFMLAYDCSKPLDISEGAQLLSLMRDLDQIAFERQLLVTQAMEWHQRMNHLDYAELRNVGMVMGDRAKERISRGMPDLSALKLKDVPACEECGWGMQERRVVL